MEVTAMTKKQWDNAPEMQIDPSKTYGVTIESSKGVIELELYPQHAPNTVNNFVFLAREGFYDGVSFHRVISNFMIQGGDPTGTGGGGPGYKFADEVKENLLKHEKGVILNGRHTVFGKVVDGQEVVDAIQQGDLMERVEIKAE
jgi:peptidyl-prolyl cis-trans isomerase B (cyclophilin B)